MTILQTQVMVRDLIVTTLQTCWQGTLYTAILQAQVIVKDLSVFDHTADLKGLNLTTVQAQVLLSMELGFIVMVFISVLAQMFTLASFRE